VDFGVFPPPQLARYWFGAPVLPLGLETPVLHGLHCRAVAPTGSPSTPSSLALALASRDTQRGLPASAGARRERCRSLPAAHEVLPPRCWLSTRFGTDETLSLAARRPGGWNAVPKDLALTSDEARAARRSYVPVAPPVTRKPRLLDAMETARPLATALQGAGARNARSFRAAKCRPLEPEPSLSTPTPTSHRESRWSSPFEPGLSPALGGKRRARDGAPNSWWLDAPEEAHNNRCAG
jgi:hypothetical protein